MTISLSNVARLNDAISCRGVRPTADGDGWRMAMRAHRGDWAAQLTAATATLSLTPTAKTAAVTLATASAALQKTAGGKKEGEIKSAYLAAVKAMEAWCAESGLASSIKGL
jgi:hypothetical protein